MKRESDIFFPLIIRDAGFSFEKSGTDVSFWFVLFVATLLEKTEMTFLS